MSTWSPGLYEHDNTVQKARDYYSRPPAPLDWGGRPVAPSAPPSRSSVLEAESARLRRGIDFRVQYPQGRIQMPASDPRLAESLQRRAAARSPNAQVAPHTFFTDGPVQRPTGSGVLDRLAQTQNNFAFNREVMFGAGGKGSSTNEARQGRADALRAQMGGEAQFGLEAAAAREKMGNDLSIARENTLGKLYSAAGNMGAASVPKTADTDGDGQLSLKERLAYAKGLKELEDARYEQVDGKTVTEPRPLRPGESVLEALFKEGLKLEDGFEQDKAFTGDSGGIVERDFSQPDTPGVTVLPNRDTLDAQGNPLRQAGPAPVNPAPAGIRNSAVPNEQHLRMLLGNRNNPKIIKAFEDKFGRGSASRYLGG